jgi:hypothetical protein
MAGVQQADSRAISITDGAEVAAFGEMSSPRLTLPDPLAPALGRLPRLRIGDLLASARALPWRDWSAKVQAAGLQAVAERRNALPAALALLSRKAPNLSEQVRSRLPALPWPEEEPEEEDPALTILADFEALDVQKQEATARNVALLWDCFVEEFGGISGFLSASETEKDDYLDKLSAAAQRMEVGRNSAAGYHYVSVVLFELYVSFFHGRKAHRSAIVLSERVAELIDEGRKLRLKEGKRPIVVVASSEAKPDTRPAPAVEETKIVVEESRSAFGAFRVGYAAKPGLQARG